MALTLVAEKRLEGATFFVLFAEHEAEWRAAAQRTKDHLAQNFPAGATIRRDDVAGALHLILEVHDRLRAKLAVSKLTQKYWISDFADLIIDRVWDTLT
ncbi:MAG: hypothetical protein KIT17_20385 [Rubrivivax sp.]|nr:hypothetical protein [Rubrivivax sp.]